MRHGSTIEWLKMFMFEQFEHFWNLWVIECLNLWRLANIWDNYYNFAVASIRFISNPNLKNENKAAIRSDGDMAMDIYIYIYTYTRMENTCMPTYMNTYIHTKHIHTYMYLCIYDVYIQNTYKTRPAAARPGPAWAAGGGLSPRPGLPGLPGGGLGWG